jgi:hypothetical protein
MFNEQIFYMDASFLSHEEKPWVVGAWEQSFEKNIGA